MPWQPKTPSRRAKFIDRKYLMYQHVVLHCPPSFVAEYTEIPWLLAMNVWIPYWACGETHSQKLSSLMHLPNVSPSPNVCTNKKNLMLWGNMQEWSEITKQILASQSSLATNKAISVTHLGATQLQWGCPCTQLQKLGGQCNLIHVGYNLHPKSWYQSFLNEFRHKKYTVHIYLFDMIMCIHCPTQGMDNTNSYWYHRKSRHWYSRHSKTNLQGRSKKKHVRSYLQGIMYTSITIRPCMNAKFALQWPTQVP